MTDARKEWISKRAYAIWEEAGRPHGLDHEHWQQAVSERDEFERVALAPETTPAKAAKKPLIEISKPADEKTKSGKKAAAAEKPIAAKAVAKAKSAKAANSKPI